MASVLLVDETPSLARAVADLLRAQGISVRMIHDPRSAIGEANSICARSKNPPVLVAACNEPSCATARLFERETSGPVNLVVIGGRESLSAPGSMVHRVVLPLAPNAFLHLIEQLIRRAPCPGPLQG